MTETREFEGRTEEEAVAEACEALGVSPEELDYTLVDEGSDGVLGLGKRPVQIRVRVPDDVEDDEFGDEEDDIVDVDVIDDHTSPDDDDDSVSGEDEDSEALEAEAGGGGSDEEEAGSEDERVGGIVGPAPEKAAAAKEVAEGLATRMGISCVVDVQDEDQQIVVLIKEATEGATDVAETLGRSRPPAIPSFQFLLNKIVNRFPDDRKHIVVEVPSVPRRERIAAEGPRSRPTDSDDDLDPTLVELARMLADRSRALNRVITVHPMAAGDRRAVHKTIMGISGVQTISEGEGLYRRMHIVPDSLRDDGQRKKRRRRRRRRGPGEEGERVPSDELEVGGEDLDSEEE